MKQIIKNIDKCNDTNALKNVSSLLCEYIDGLPCNEGKLELMKNVASEITGCSYDEELSNMHLCLIGKIHTVAEADFMWKGENNISRYDWRVLWGEMERIHEEKIKRWFPKHSKMDMREKIYDECVTFLKAGLSPWHDIGR